ncbi:DUF1214 domain-containing protein [Pseudomonas sp. S37]|mgnify:CR=1 FL=1|uniref:hypothetical protein n=1 Tax=unclassified Pseudomonas TaxID=196821 RepID=UPI0019130B54|nr:MULTISPECIES: hypothetical protein [unclassified Pseudomonas]MBK4987621.1 DUF1214 domain-containing protein [Pseudomonas sp. S36]MBK4991932.1 DUF1214 domain-containing protein [Pseudomonas sp. S37]
MSQDRSSTHLPTPNTLQSLNDLKPQAELFSSALLTKENKELENLCLRLFNSPNIQATIEKLEKQLGSLPLAQTADAQKTLPSAVRELAMGAISYLAADDPQRPNIMLHESPPRRDWPGARYIVDNPDNVYRIVAIDSHSQYLITGKLGSAPPSQYLFELTSSWKGMTGENHIAMLANHEVLVGFDGFFEITIDNQPANGRANHIQSTADAKYLMIRDVLSDWAKQSPNRLSIRRVSGPSLQPRRAFDKLTKDAEALVPEFVDYWLPILSSIQPVIDGEIPELLLRTGGWGWVVNRRFTLVEDEVLVITVDPGSANYIGTQVMDPWARSRNYINKTGSLNGAQAVSNPDGTYTYVLSNTDPKFVNWLSTDGLLNGYVSIRVQGIPSGGSIGGVKSFHILSIEDLPDRITRRHSSSISQTLLDKRMTSYSRRNDS